MKRLIKLIWWVAVIAGIIWMLRDRLVPAPETEPDPPPHYRVSPPAPPVDVDSAPEAEDDLEVVKGIGPVYAARLTDLGISSFASLAAADAEQLAERLNVRAEQTADWIEQAQALAG